MSDVLPRLRRRVRRSRVSKNYGTHDQAQLADEYARVLGLHLTADEQLARFKETTEGAPLVRRARRRSLPV